MKTIKILLFVSFIAMSANVMAGHHKAVEIISSRLDVVYLRLECPMIGGKVEIVDATGKVIETLVVDSKKMLIDFFYFEPGQYTIKVKHGDLETDFTYNK